MISNDIEALVRYAIDKNLIEESDRVWAENSLLAALGIDGFQPGSCTAQEEPLENILARILDWAEREGLCGGDTVSRDQSSWASSPRAPRR